tara:strand:- start:136 stop:282 length:147 start_codon:yes stop_codon:yes gene_type:complete
MIETLSTVGYVIASAGLVVCIISYFAIPKLVRFALEQKGEDQDEDSKN